MRKKLLALLTLLLLGSLLLVACSSADAPDTVEEPAEDPMKIAFFVSDLSNVFHQAQIAEATKYAVWSKGVF